ERAFHIDGLETRRPVIERITIGLCRLARGAQSHPPRLIVELQPPRPSSVRLALPAHARPEEFAVGRSDVRAVSVNELRHKVSPDPKRSKSHAAESTGSVTDSARGPRRFSSG